MLGIIPQIGRNRFESPSLPNSENLTGVHFIVVIDGSVGYEGAQVDMVIIILT